MACATILKLRRGCFAVAFGLLLACTACGDDSGSDGDNGPTGGSRGTSCVRGTSYSCIGPGNCNGRQLCTQEAILGSCVCTGGSPDAGRPPDGGMRDSGVPADGAVGDAATQDAATQDAGPDAAPGAENCDNDQDDDGDGDDDCADSDCAERTCVEEAPAGWFGPVLLYEGDEPPPACSGGYPDEAARGGTTVSGPAATCSACTCSPTNPGCAAFLNFETGTNSGCTPDPACLPTAVNSNCQALTSPCLGQGTGYVQALLPATQSCAPSTSQPTVTPADWDRYALVCEAPEFAAAGCAAGNVCAPKKPFDGELCIYDYFDVPCPSGPYTDRRVYGTGIADTRGCSDCLCAQDCSYTWRVFDSSDTTCAGTADATLTEADQCGAVTPVAAGLVHLSTSIAGTGACTPSGGQPTGSAQGQNPITVCCLP